MEKDIYEDTEAGVAQGACISPVLANIYLHYALDLWFQIIVKKSCRGQAEIVRYADDFVCCFQLKEDAERFYKALIKRLAKFSLEIAEEKTKILAFGRFAADNGKRQGLGKPGTFDFLGFTHYCSKKDALYRLKNNEKLPWRALLLAITKQFQQLVNPNKEIADKSAFILDKYNSR